MVNGKRISVTDEDKNICQAKAMAIQSGLMEKEGKKKTITLEDAIQSYIEEKTGTLSPSTIRGYDILKRHRFKGIMKKNIFTLTKTDLQTAVNQEVKFASPKTIFNAYGLVRPVLRQYGVPASYENIKLPQIIKKEKAYIQPDEVGNLLNACSGDKHELPILMALWLGMRRSEILGLCWDCVDENAGTVTIKRTIVRDKDNKTVLREGTKNRSSNRTIRCPDYIIEKLRKLRMGKKDGRVFDISDDVIRRRIHQICEETGITDTNTHGLRHTNAATMRYIGMSDAHAMERGGWSDEKTYKNVYSYVFDSVAEEEDGKLNDYFLEKLHTDLHTKT